MCPEYSTLIIKTKHKFSARNENEKEIKFDR